MSTLETLKQPSTNQEQAQADHWEEVADLMATDIANRLYSLTRSKLEGLDCTARHIEIYAKEIQEHKEMLEKAAAERVAADVAAVTQAMQEACKSAKNLASTLRHLETITEEDCEEVQRRRRERLLNPWLLVASLFALAAIMGAGGYVWQEKNRARYLTRLEAQGQQHSPLQWQQRPQ